MDFSGIVKVVFGVVGTFVSALVGGLGLAFTVLLGMMIIDIATGLLVGGKTKSLSSRISSVGIIRKVYVLLLIGAVYLIQSAVPVAEFAGDGITIAFIISEFISIVENGVKLNVPMPEKIKEVISKYKKEDE